MSRKLPYGKFKWFDYKIINAVNKNYDSFQMYDLSTKLMENVENKIHYMNLF